MVCLYELKFRLCFLSLCYHWAVCNIMWYWTVIYRESTLLWFLSWCCLHKTHVHLMLILVNSAQFQIKVYLENTTASFSLMPPIHSSLNSSQSYKWGIYLDGSWLQPPSDRMDHEDQSCTICRDCVALMDFFQNIQINQFFCGPECAGLCQILLYC